jgi:hypothetical protein
MMRETVMALVRKGARAFLSFFMNDQRGPLGPTLEYHGVLSETCGSHIERSYPTELGDMNPPKTVDELLRWRIRTWPHTMTMCAITPERLVWALSCEGLPWDTVDEGFEGAVKKFRKLRQDARLRAAKRVLAER